MLTIMKNCLENLDNKSKCICDIDVDGDENTN